jgi:hypothetical protein
LYGLLVCYWLRFRREFAVIRCVAFLRVLYLILRCCLRHCRTVVGLLQTCSVDWNYLRASFLLRDLIFGMGKTGSSLSFKRALAMGYC